MGYPLSLLFFFFFCCANPISRSVWFSSFPILLQKSETNFKKRKTKQKI